jgi:hypothetical protein
MRNITGYAIVMVLLVGLTVGCREKKEETPPVTDVVAEKVASLPTSPTDDAWSQVSEMNIELMLQDQVDPRLLEESTETVRVRALSDGNRVAFRLEWNDETQDDRSTSAMFGDACAVQLPAEIEPDVPSPQMGEEGRPVHIAYWSAVWQAAVEGRGDTVEDLYPNMSIDHYPFEAESLEKGSPEQEAMAARYAPAHALHNMMGGPRDNPVQDLIAEGPGTLAPAETTTSKGSGQRNENGWSVVITRQLPKGVDSDAPAQVAFAIWNGAKDEVGARKMRTGWITLEI